MAWNRPSENVNSKRAARRSPPAPHIKGLIAGGIVVVGAAVAAWCLWPSAKRAADTTSERKGLIRESPPAAAPKEENTEKTKIPDPPERPPQRVGEARDGKVLMPNGELRAIKGEVTNSTARIKAPYAIFRHSSENILAGLLVAEPGQGMVGTPRYNGVFTKNFLKSLEEPIVIENTDDEDAKALKRAVIEAKAELKAAYDRGEDIEQIILDSRKDLQQLAKVRENIKRDVIRIAHETAETEDDVNDLLKAANKMLEDNGIAPLDETPLTNVRLQLMKRRLLNSEMEENGK